MDLRSRSARSPLVRYGFASALAGLALGIQFLIHPLTAPDSYQIFLGFVALSVIYSGAASGFVTLALTTAAKLWFFVLPNASLATQGHVVVSRTILYATVGVVICSLGGQLHASERTLAAVLSSMQDAVLATDEKGRIRFLNAGARALTGWNEEQARGGDLAAVVRLLDRRSGEPATLPGEDGWRGREFRLLSRDGRETPVTGSSAAIRDSGGHVRGAVTVLRDTSEHEQLVSQVKRLTGLLPICAACKKIRDKQGAWHQIESYIATHSEADFSHGICPECMLRLYPELADLPR